MFISLNFVPSFILFLRNFIISHLFCYLCYNLIRRDFFISHPISIFMVLFVFYNDLPEENVQIIIGNFIIGVGSVSIVNSAVIVIVRFYVNLKINLQLDNYLSKA